MEKPAEKTPDYIFISEEEKERLIEEYLVELALERERNCTGVFYSHEEVIAELVKARGISMEEYMRELEEIPMEYGVDFE
jgi:hypothetical protein